MCTQGKLKAAAIRKQDGYAPLFLAFCHYIGKGWTVHVFPWVVGIRGLIDPSLIVSLLALLDIPYKHRKTAVERTVLASVKALYFMHQVRFGGMHDRKRTADNRQNNSSDGEETDDDELQTDPSGRRRTRLAQATRASRLQTRVSSTATRHTIVERASPASLHPVNDLIVEETVLYGNNRAAANTIRNAMGDAALLLPAAKVAVSRLEKACAATANRVSTNAGFTVAAADSGEQQVVKAVADVMRAAMSTAVSKWHRRRQLHCVLRRG
jgi:hypothetical protein